ncbi:RidA family protein [Pararhodobacter sp. CCB-MM2]|uniref:RidA family protein n=1 Tax=Pararhodobacter sp. CCB-MM2 TaxID=1786003 RepID=UPI00082F4F0E|nr:RidA family protein [Pararhodobacter sp. CCB-MM2]
MTEKPPITRLHNVGKLSRVVSYQGTIYLSGLTAADKSTDTADQARQIFARADELLAEAGTDRSRLLFTQIWLRDIGDFDAMNAAWMAWIGDVDPPARATVEAKFALPEIRIEVQFTAAA